MFNNFPFFRFPFYPYSHSYSNYYRPNNYKKNPEIKPNLDKASDSSKDFNKEKKSSKYNSIVPFFIHTDGFFDKEKPVLEFLGLTLYLDDLMILSILFFLYKEDVKDDMLFILLILLLIG